MPKRYSGGVSVELSRDNDTRIKFRVSLYMDGVRGASVPTFKGYIDKEKWDKYKVPNPEEWDDEARRALHLACVPGHVEQCTQCSTVGVCPMCHSECNKCGGTGNRQSPSTHEAALFNAAIEWERAYDLSRAVVRRSRPE